MKDRRSTIDKRCEGLYSDFSNAHAHVSPQSLQYGFKDGWDFRSFARRAVSGQRARPNNRIVMNWPRAIAKRPDSMSMQCRKGALKRQEIIRFLDG
jgi:hypothetical protein